MLHDIHFDLNKGETKSVIGSTGSGKSTLVRLMMRDYDAYRGQITYNGQDITSLTNAEINQIITHIPQTTFLFSGTIRENLQTGKKDATDNEIWEVLDMVQMGDFFRQTKEKLDFYIAQMPSIYRAARNNGFPLPAIDSEDRFYVFDDCFSAGLFDRKEGERPYGKSCRTEVYWIAQAATVGMPMRFSLLTMEIL